MPGVESRELAGTPEQLAARGRLYWDDATGRISFIAQNLAQPAADSTYELWFITQAGQTVSLGTFTLDEIGSARYVTTLTQLPTDVSQAAVSLEPAGGSPQTSPTGPIVMASSTE